MRPDKDIGFGGGERGGVVEALGQDAAAERHQEGLGRWVPREKGYDALCVLRLGRRYTDLLAILRHGHIADCYPTLHWQNALRVALCEKQHIKGMDTLIKPFSNVTKTARISPAGEIQLSGEIDVDDHTYQTKILDNVNTVSFQPTITFSTT